MPSLSLPAPNPRSVLRDMVPNTDFFRLANTPGMGHVNRMEDGRLPNVILYSEHVAGTSHAGCPIIGFKDVCQRDMKSAKIEKLKLEVVSSKLNNWRNTIMADRLCVIKWRRMLNLFNNNNNNGYF